MELYITGGHEKACTYAFDNDTTDPQPLLEAVRQYTDNALVLRMNNNTVFIDGTQFDAARQIFQEKFYRFQDADKLVVSPENCSCIAVSTFMQILGDQLFDDARTVTPFANLIIKGQPNPPLISPSRFGAMLMEARRRSALKKGFVIFAGILEGEMLRLQKEEKKKWDALDRDEQQRLEQMSRVVAQAVQVYLLYHDRDNKLQVDRIDRLGKIVQAVGQHFAQDNNSTDMEPSK